MLALVQALLDEWHSNDILYCHWKSNEAIARGLNGEGDLDVLVHQSDVNKTYDALTRLGFKRLTEQPYKAYPGIEHWLGLSTKEGTFVHVHLHYRLIYGEKFIKAHRFPYEQQVLDKRIFSDGIYQISREDELLFLFIRSMLKVDFIWIIKKQLGLEKQYLPTLIFREYQFLLNDISVEELKERKSMFAHSIPFDKMFDAIQHIETLNLKQIITWKRSLLRSLSLERRLSVGQKSLTFIRVYLSFVMVKLGLLKKAKKRLFTGGKTIALLGADGAGKSTMLKELDQWLGKYLDVDVLYTGSGDGNKSYALSLFDYLNGLKNKYLHKEEIINIAPKEDVSSKKGTVKNRIKNIRAWLIARHRLTTITQGILSSNNGKIVLYDRYPQPFNRDYSDGPKVIDDGGSLSTKMYQWEQSLYEKMFERFPDRCFILMVDPKVSVDRKGEDSEQVISNKNAVLEQLIQMKRSQVDVVDANQPYEKVLLKLKELTWRNL